MAEEQAPRAYRWVIAAASRIVPRRFRGDWKRRWDSDILHWWAFLAEHGALDSDARTQLLRYSWSAFPDALRMRWAVSGGGVLSVVRSPGLCLALVALPLVLAGLWTGFSGIRALVEPLPYKDPGRLALLARLEPGVPMDALRGAVRVEALAVYATDRVEFRGRELLRGRVEPGLFELLGVRAAVGRLFDERDGAARPAAVLSHRLWQRAFGGDAGVVARRITLGGTAYDVVGVLPPDFWFLRREIALWTAITPPGPRVRGGREGGAVVRLKDYAEPRDAERELSYIAWSLKPQHGVRVQVLPIEERLRFALHYYLAVLAAALAAAVILAAVGFRRSRRGGVFLVGKSFLLLVGLAALAVEATAAAATAMAGRVGFMEVWFSVAAILGTWWSWHDQRRRCRVCQRRLTLPVSFGNWGSPLLDRVGTELVCTRGHGTLYVPGMHWSSAEPERWTNFDASYNDLFTGKG